MVGQQIVDAPEKEIAKSGIVKVGVDVENRGLSDNIENERIEGGHEGEECPEPEATPEKSGVK
jgi:hypothetical protein